MRAFKVLDPGILTTFQDLGRTGFRKYGIPPSGAADTLALRAANVLVGNPETAIGLEVALQGLRMMTLEPLSIAVTGADLDFTVNTAYLRPWRSVSLKAGDEIHFRRRRSGLRAYLAVSGGFVAPVFLGSGSVFQRGAMGAPLMRDQILEKNDTPAGPFPERVMPDEQIPRTISQEPIRVIRGPQMDRFTQDGVNIFLGSEYRIRSDSDRMAYRLEGPEITHLGRADIISEPVVPGSVQVPNDGHPIILMVDAQVTGGYAKIAVVISADMPVLAQKIPGDRVRFEAVEPDTAYQALREKERLLVWLRTFISKP